MDLDRLAAAARTLPILEFSGVTYRQTDPRRGPFEVQRVATYEARWHRKGQPAPIYTTPSSALGAMLEQARHTDARGGGAVLPQRLLSELQVTALPYVDYANELAWEVLNIRRDDLIGDDFEIPQLLADVVRDRPEAFAFLAPSAAQRGASTLVIFSEAVSAHLRVLSTRKVELRIVPSPAPPPPPSP